ncbi:FAD binding domain protein [Daldinia decipiens]|uniref:FAD binding domain protein n=1 Tax=Daldinia decipiens TaxID=326647 RepID=UPI0020C1D6D7|nr:FAD binding domain protein [Daldinia decipiens]KAI1657308.1 FAD binding domain protein [Daldinia decipiens]
MDSQDSATRPFRVIVVGGGIAGLMASNCLQRAGIDHVVLEKRAEIAPAEGASISVYPNSTRILHQIGCLETVESAGAPANRVKLRLPDGTIISDIDLFEHLKENHGNSGVIIERRRLLQILYDNLPTKSLVKLGCSVKRLRHVEDDIEAVLADETVEIGDMVIGCDGVHSSVRSMMWDYANKTIPGSVTMKEKMCMKANWKVLILVGPTMPEIGRDTHFVHNTHFSFTVISQPDHVFTFVTFRLKEPVIWPRRMFYTAQDAEHLAETVASYPVCESLLFGELWRKRERASLVNIEEGVLNKWHCGRIVLAGDAAHKFTFHMGFGANSSIGSIATLCNQLKREIVSRNEPSLSPSTLERIFESYQTKRYARMKTIMDLSLFSTRILTWDTLLTKLLSRWIFPWLPERYLTDQFSKIIKGEPKLEYIGTGNFPRGRLTWEDEVTTGDSEDEDLE